MKPHKWFAPILLCKDYMVHEHIEYNYLLSNCKTFFIFFYNSLDLLQFCHCYTSHSDLGRYPFQLLQPLRKFTCKPPACFDRVLVSSVKMTMITHYFHVQRIQCKTTSSTHWDHMACVSIRSYTFFVTSLTYIFITSIYYLFCSE